jgi:soluble lytic murein transglycosylase-like protein
MSRVHVAAIAIVAFATLSGSPASPPGDAQDSNTAGRAAVAARIQGLNPALAPATAARIWQAVDRYASKYDLPADLVLAVLEVESRGRVEARSPKGALGLMQVMPHMAARLDLAGNHTTVETNIEAGCVILAHNIRRLGEDDGVSAYFWGSDIRGVSYLHRVQRARAGYRRLLAH